VPELSIFYYLDSIGNISALQNAQLLIPGAMYSELNEDIYTSVFEHVDDLPSLRSTIEAISISKYHPLHNIVFRRLLRRPLRFSSDTLEATEALIEFLVDKSHADGVSAERIRWIELSLGPSRSAYIDSKELRSMVGHAAHLVKILPRMFAITTNLRHLTWTKIPLPDVENLKVLAELPRFESLSVDCATGLWSGRNMDELDEYWA
jgi:hypothetical protein